MIVFVVVGSKSRAQSCVAGEPESWRTDYLTAAARPRPADRHDSYAYAHMEGPRLPSVVDDTSSACSSGASMQETAHYQRLDDSMFHS